jgi:hypothetical protein
MSRWSRWPGSTAQPFDPCHPPAPAEDRANEPTSEAEDLAPNSLPNLLDSAVTISDEALPGEVEAPGPRHRAWVERPHEGIRNPHRAHDVPSSLSAFDDAVVVRVHAVRARVGRCRERAFGVLILAR